MKNKLTLEEQETIIIWDRSSDLAEVYTCEPSLIRRLNKLTEKEESSIIRRDSQSVISMMPKSWIKIKPPAKKNLTDKQRQAIADRLMESRK